MSTTNSRPQTPPGTNGHPTPDDYREPEDLRGFLPGDAPRNGTEPPTETPCPAADARPAEGPGTTPPTPVSPSPPNPLSNTPVSITRVPRGRDEPMLVLDVMTLGEVVEFIQNDEGLREETKRLRAMLDQDGRKTPTFNAAKKRLKAAVPALSAPVGTSIEGVSAEFHNSLYGYDVDENTPDLAQLRRDLSATPGVVMVGISVSGTGLWCLVLGPKADSLAAYKARHAAILAQMPESVQKANGKASKNLNRLRYLASDPDLFYNPHTPAFVVTAEALAAARKKPAAGKKTSGADKSPDRKVLPQALEFLAGLKMGQDDDRLLGVGQCLKAMGHDFQEWDEWAAQAGCSCDNRQARWGSFTAADTTYDAIIGMAVNAGWEKPGRGRPRGTRRLDIEAMAARGWQITGGKSPELIHNSAVNAKLGLEETGWADRLRLNGWTGLIELDDKPADINDFEQLARFRLEASHTAVGFRPASIHVRTAIRVVAEERGYNPTLDNINRVAWDGVDRYSTLAQIIVGNSGSDADRVLDTAIAALIVRGMVVRAIEPGSIVGYAPVLRSKHEGPGKGTVIEILAPGGHSVGAEFSGSNWAKDIKDKLRNVSALEIAEHDSLAPRGEANLKSFITTLVTNERSSYAARAIPENIRAMLFITTNRRYFLNGVEHRRFPVLTIPKGHFINLMAVNEMKYQLWAHAALEYRKGYFRNNLGKTEVTLPQGLWDAANKRSKQYEAVSTVKDQLAFIIGDRTELPAGAFQQELTDKLKRRVQNQEFSRAMDNLGWVRHQVGKSRDHVWLLEEE